MGSNFFIDIGITVILAVLRTRKIPAGYVKAFIKLRDALNVVFPATLEADFTSGSEQKLVARGVTVTKDAKDV